MSGRFLEDVGGCEACPLNISVIFIPVVLVLSCSTNVSSNSSCLITRFKLFHLNELLCDEKPSFAGSLQM